ncbi:thioester domain-containing protein [Phytomonospora sp. NPDC050363]|uniref:thioester domain-containing protein n=1 Tax=Phytomonospora sp. NPDC050363 TaxID=3155642 RepID=UPI0033E84697
MKTRLIKTALVAAVAGITLIGTATAVNADPSTLDTKDAKGRVTAPKAYPNVKVQSASDQKHSAHVLRLTSNGEKQFVYCIDLHTELNFGHEYGEGDWDNSGVANLGKIKWVLHNGFNNVDTVDALLATAGVTLPAGLSKNEKVAVAYAGTQASVWNFSDGFALHGTDTTDWDSGDAAEDAAVDLAVSKLYTHLTSKAVDMPDPGEPNVAFDGPTTGKVGEKIGPYTVDTNLGNITLTVEGGKAVDKDGKEITEVKGGDEFYLITDKPGEITVKGVGEVNVPLGRIFLSTQGKSQKLILAGAMNKPGEAQLKVTAELVPTNSPTPSPSDTPTSSPTVPPTTTTTPGGGLPVTGSSLTIIGVTGAALLAGGAALVLFMRRRRAAASTWGSDEDGLA